MKPQYIVIIIIFLILFGVSFYYYPQMPQRVPIDWDEKGAVQGHGPKTVWVFFLPSVSIFLFLLLYYIPYLDPINKNFKGFRDAYDWLIVILLLFLTYDHVLLSFAMMSKQLPFVSLLVAGVGVLIFLMGNVMKHLKRNYFAGIRTPWTLESDLVWDKTHAFSGTLFKITGIIVILNSFFSKYAIWIILITMLVTVVIAGWYSYYAYKHSERRKK